MEDNTIKLFENKQIRTVWDEQQEKWYFSVVDVIEVLTDTDRPRKYWSDLKSKLQKEGSELSAKIGQLKMQSSKVRNRLYRLRTNPKRKIKRNNTYVSDISKTLKKRLSTWITKKALTS